MNLIKISQYSNCHIFYGKTIATKHLITSSDLESVESGKRKRKINNITILWGIKILSGRTKQTI